MVASMEHSTDVSTTPGKKKVGGYIIGETIGEGSFAKVRVGTHILTQERVAIKIIDKRMIIDREYVKKNLRREAAVLRKLNHCNITKLYEVLETQNNYYIIMELAEGGEFMRHLCDRRKLSERETRKFMRQLVSSVEFMHQAKLVHRDLKIENFLLDAEKNLKVIDFGLSNFLGPDELLRTQCGSPAYAAPEIFSSNGYGPEVDVWSIGVNMYAMLTGELPFTADPPTDMFKLHTKIMEGCTYPEYLTRDCKDLLSRLLTVDVASRITLIDVMKHSWMNRGHRQCLRPYPYPSKISAGNLNLDVLDYMVNIGYSANDVIERVAENRPVPDNATYHLLLGRLQKGLNFPQFPRTSRSEQSKSYRNSFSRTGEHVPLTDNLIDIVSNVCSNKTADDDDEYNTFTVVNPANLNEELARIHPSSMLLKAKLRTQPSILEDLTNSIKEIDLNNNKNENCNPEESRNENTTSHRATSIIKKLEVRKPRCSKVYSRRLEKCNVRPNGLQNILETDCNGKEQNQCSVIDTSRQQCKSRPRLYRSMSHTTSKNSLAYQSSNQNCLIFINGKIIEDIESCISSSMNHTKGKVKEQRLICRPREMFRRSYTDPSIYSLSPRPNERQFSEHSKLNQVSPHKPIEHQKTTKAFWVAAFGFPTRLKSYGQQLVRFDK